MSLQPEREKLRGVTGSSEGRRTPLITGVGAVVGTAARDKHRCVSVLGAGSETSSIATSEAAYGRSDTVTTHRGNGNAFVAIRSVETPIKEQGGRDTVLPLAPVAARTANLLVFVACMPIWTAEKGSVAVATKDVVASQPNGVMGVPMAAMSA